MHDGSTQIQSGMSENIKTKFISRKHVKAYALAMAEQRAHKFTRVGGEFFIKCEAQMKTFIRNYVKSLPSKGKTIT
jgi:NADPH-dependent ferric siderophore reductase